MEIQVPQRTDVIDLEAADFQLFEPVARQERPCGGAFRAGLAEHAMGLQIAPDRGVRRTAASLPAEAARRLSKCSCMVQPGCSRYWVVRTSMAWAIRLGKRPTSSRKRFLRAATGSAAAWRRSTSVPASRRRSESPSQRADDARTWQPAVLERRLQFARGRRCGQQGADDREAQARPTITLEGIDNRFQKGLPVGDAGGIATGSEG